MCTAERSACGALGFYFQICLHLKCCGLISGISHQNDLCKAATQSVFTTKKTLQETLLEQDDWICSHALLSFALLDSSILQHVAAVLLIHPGSKTQLNHFGKPPASTHFHKLLALLRCMHSPADNSMQSAWPAGATTEPTVQGTTSLLLHEDWKGPGKEMKREKWFGWKFCCLRGDGSV